MKTQKKSPKTENIITRWYKLAEPNKTTWFFQCLFYTCHSALVALLTVFAAKTIDSLYASDWKMAFIWLACEIASIVV